MAFGKDWASFQLGSEVFLKTGKGPKLESKTRKKKNKKRIKAALANQLFPHLCTDAKLW